ncbi:hypothetical protein PGT21_029079 [Puccinia graminis f. sp. tritici]|uniref:Glutamate--cysteine ligase n=1 Tax=Puccinia graminis f. sp. tritici TaxID=56615 RepID=A0A5B0RQS7_PUCGR|nr:hypothetical protein PGT21_029079 [Puccinia graminis f. sp. tritici]KAA1127987.1 hypothetical protein PGTUg99_013604 [Puccinia graminis f. sp. tritici]
MGLLALGTPFDWLEAKQYADHVRQQGIKQFLRLWRNLQGRTDDLPLWGDEIEYFLVSLDHTTRQANLALRQEEVLESLQQPSTAPLPPQIDVRPTFHQEYGRYMLESTPGAPYISTLEDCLRVEFNMRYRRELIRAKLAENERLVTLTSFPRLGAPQGFTVPYEAPCGSVAQSLYLPDDVINQHIRFPTLTRNIRKRRGSKVAIFVPVFPDLNTPKPFRDPTVPAVPPETSVAPGALPSPLANGDRFPNGTEKIAIPAIPDNSIYLDAMGFGMGCSCLQTTYQAQSVTQARYLYDALATVAPIMMALSAAAPIFKGFLSDVDCRWDVISGAVDDRTEPERSPENLNQKYIPKSRYDSISLYIADDARHRPEYDDVLAPVDKSIESQLIQNGLDHIMARHIAHLFIRDPLVIFSETLEPRNDDSMDHFENLQSTNWQSVRFKPPPSASSSSDIGWRVEFRTMEVQITDFENAAYSIFVVLLIRAILMFDVNFYIPLSKVDENMRRAQQRDAARSSLFYFRTQIQTKPNTTATSSLQQQGMTPSVPVDGIKPEFEEMTMDEIIHGKQSSQYPGLMHLVISYVDKTDADDLVKENIKKYLDFISARATGRLMTTAAYIRKFVQEHPAYQHDSVVSSEINYDLICRINQIEAGKHRAEELVGPGYSSTLPHT